MRVLTAVLCGIGGRMPKGILEEEEAQQVAQFVAAYAGQIGKGPVVNTADTPVPDFNGCPTAADANNSRHVLRSRLESIVRGYAADIYLCFRVRACALYLGPYRR